MSKILLLIVLLFSAGAGVYVYLNRDAHNLPDEYTQTPNETAPASVAEDTLFSQTPDNAYPDSSSPAPADASPGASKYPALQEINRELQQDGQVKLTAEKLDTLFLNFLHSKSGGEIPGLVKVLKSEIHQENIAVELIVDTNKIPWQKLPPDVQIARRFIEMTSPNELFCRISGRPAVKDNSLVMDDDSTIQIGKMQLPLKTLLSSTGNNGQIPLKGAFKSLRLEEGAVILE